MKIQVTKTLRKGDAFLSVSLDGKAAKLPVHPDVFRLPLREGAELSEASLHFVDDGKGHLGLRHYDVVGEARGARGLALALGKGDSK